MRSDCRKNHGRGQRKTEGTISAIFDIRTTVKCCELKRCADRVRSRTDNKDEVLRGKFSNLNFSPSTKKTTEYSFILFLSIYRFFDIVSQVLNFTSVELSRFATQAKLKNLFFKSDGGHTISRQGNTPVAQKHRAISRQEKRAVSTLSGCLETPLPLPQSL